MKRWAQAALGWNVLTILLGALVRATHSGAGCGRSWPTCDGQIVPDLGGATTIEYIHRLASGVALILVFAVALLAWRQTNPGDPLRRAALWSAAAIIGEALIGAAIVLYEWVGADNSLARVIAVPLHLVNTLLLLAALTMSIWFAGGGARLSRRGPPRRWFFAGVVGMMAIAATGAITALADTLFPKAGEVPIGATHFLTELRIIHPIVAVGVVATASLLVRASGRRDSSSLRLVVSLTLGQFVIGAANIWLGTPIWMQLLHLLVADSIWIAYVWLGAEVLSSNSASSVADEVGLRQTIPEHR
jgi:heme A synthase